MGSDESLSRFFFGLDVGFPWDETLLLICIWAVFGVEETDWNVWKMDTLERHSHDERLKRIIDQFGAGPLRGSATELEPFRVPGRDAFTGWDPTIWKNWSNHEGSVVKQRSCGQFRCQPSTVKRGYFSANDMPLLPTSVELMPFPRPGDDVDLQGLFFVSLRNRVMLASQDLRSTGEQSIVQTDPIHNQAYRCSRADS